MYTPKSITEMNNSEAPDVPALFSSFYDKNIYIIIIIEITHPINAMPESGGL